MTTRDIQRMAKRTGRTISVFRETWFHDHRNFTSETDYTVSIFGKIGCWVEFSERDFETLKAAAAWVKDTLQEELKK